MFSFSWPAKKNVATLIIDIGSGSVGGALVRNGIIEACFREEFPVGTGPALSQYERAIDRTLGSVLTKLAKTHPLIKTAYCFLATPWHIPEIRRIKLQKNELFSFGTKEKNEAIARDRAQFESELDQRYKRHGHEIIAMEEHLISVSVNGYRVSLASPHKTAQADIAYYLGLSDAVLLQRIRDRLERHVGAREILFSSSTYAWYGALKQAPWADTEHLLVLIEDRTTVISVVGPDGLSGIHSFPHGKDHVLEALARQTRTSAHDALTMMTLHAKGTLDEARAASLAKALPEAAQPWLAEFRRALEALAHRLSLPETVIVSANATFSPVFETAIRDEDFAQLMLTEKKFTVIPADLSAAIAEIGHQANGCTDRALLTETLFASSMDDK